MRFLHTADWQLGMKAAHVGEAGRRVREERLLAARRVIEAAQSHSVEFILIAGDTFEDNGVDRVLIQKVADLLSSFDGPVYIIPGNHDPLVPGSVWEHPVWQSTQNARVLHEEEPIGLLGGLLFPCPVQEKYSSKDPTKWIQTGEAEGIRIGIAHGTVESIHQDEPDYPVSRDAAERARLHYLALGHWHSTVLYEAEDGAVRMAYSGTHEPSKFGERDSGNVLVVDIADPGSAPEVQPVPTGGLVWRQIETELREPGDLRRLREDIESAANPDLTLARISVKGLLASDERDQIARINEILGARFLFGSCDMSQVRPSPEDESWLANLPPGVIRDATARLLELTNLHFEGQRPESASPDVASRALLELYTLVAGEEP